LDITIGGYRERFFCGKYWNWFYIVANNYCTNADENCQ